MKLFKIVGIGKFWELGADEEIDENDDIFVGRIMTEERLRFGFETTLRNWDGSLDDLNEKFEHYESYDDFEEEEHNWNDDYRIVFESVGVDL